MCYPLTRCFWHCVIDRDPANKRLSLEPLVMRTITSDTSVHAQPSLALRLNGLRDRVYIVVLTAKLAVDCPKHVRHRLTLSLETAVLPCQSV